MSTYWMLILFIKYVAGYAGGSAAIEISTYATKAECEAAGEVTERSFPREKTIVGGINAKAICVEVVR